MAIQNGKVLGLFAPSYTLNGIEEHLSESTPSRTIPTLLEMTERSLQILSQNKNGFFLMVEGGQIDIAAYGNDAGTVLHEMVRFDRTLKLLFDWVNKHDDTLLVITADHETGGFGFSYKSPNSTPPLTLSGPLFAKTPYESKFEYGSYQILDKLFEQKKSYEKIFSEFETIDSKARTSEHLRNLINESTQFPISLSEAQEIMELYSGQEPSTFRFRQGYAPFLQTTSKGNLLASPSSARLGIRKLMEIHSKAGFAPDTRYGPTLNPELILDP